jgi:pyrroline-5-carboxylate reductase
MGLALLRGWLDAGMNASFVVIEPSLRHKIKGATFLKKPNNELKTCDIIVIAVKPQVADEVCTGLKPYIKKDALILSIAAGRSIKSFEKIFGAAQPIIRSMPNLPASIGQGITVAVANKNVKAAQKKSAAELLACAGLVEWTENEKLLNAVTAVSGSGPAYVFLLIEVLSKSAQKAGLNKKISDILARQTVIGSAALAAHEPKIDAATLRKNVTSPGGTTEAALDILMNGDMQKIFDYAIASAKKRGEELNS